MKSFHLTPAGVRQGAMLREVGRHRPGVSWVGGQTGTRNFHKAANLFPKGSIPHPSPAHVGWSGTGWAAYQVSGCEITGHRDSSSFFSLFFSRSFIIWVLTCLIYHLSSHISGLGCMLNWFPSMGWRAAGGHFSSRGCSPVRFVPSRSLRTWSRPRPRVCGSLHGPHPGPPPVCISTSRPPVLNHSASTPGLHVRSCTPADAALLFQRCSGLF